MFTYFYAQTPMHVYILLCPYANTCFHISTLIQLCMFHSSTPIYDLYMFTYYYAHIRTIHAYILLRLYTLWNCVHSSTPIYAYVFIYYHTHIHMHFYILLHLHNYTCLHISMPILHPIPAYKSLRPYTYAYLHTSMPMCLYMFTYCSAHLNI